jgi:O-antigen biosynthesis protein WbqV
MARGPSHRVVLNLALDSLLALAALPLAVWAAAPGAWPPAAWWAGALPGAVLALAAAGAPLRLPLQYWRFAGLRDLLAVGAAAVLAATVFALGLHLAGAWRPPNPAFPVLHAGVLAVLLVGGRVAALLQAARHASDTSPDAQNVLLVGAAEGTDVFLRALAHDRRAPYRVTGILSLRARQAGRRMQGTPILGTVEDTEQVLDALRGEGRLPSVIVLASGLSGPALEGVLDAADRHGVPVRRAPAPTTLAPAGEDAQRVELRPVSIEDLLDRPQVPLDREGMARLVQGRRVLVTGAGGTIGGELARQVAALGPSSLTLLDHGEYVLYEIDLELREKHPEVARRAVLADVRDEARIRRLFDDIRPELVFHAAALKHVPMVENDPLEGLLTNALGTRIVADAARSVGTTAMVFISTDKAVNPTSVMGASKRLAEMYCQALDVEARSAGKGEGRGGMRCITVRFGNVLGSTGSVVPLFRRQLERGGPLTVTHPDMRRYFMTVREAVGLVLQASVVGTTDPDNMPPELAEGGIFVLDMGEAVKIVDLARRMIRLAGLRPDEDVEIRFTGLRPGERLFEELFHGQEPPRPTAYPGLMVATPRTADPALVGRAIGEIASAGRAGNPRAALQQLARLVPEFAHAPDGTAAAGPGGSR